ncbi:PLDc N-terminal domain-containing protein [Christiangramia lutea]
MSLTEKIIWLVYILLAPLLGTLLYVILARNIG